MSDDWPMETNSQTICVNRGTATLNVAVPLCYLGFSRNVKKV